MLMSQIAKHITFIGRVQGVGFRFTAMNIANRNGLTGYVRNLADGTVEMIAQGHKDDIKNTIEDLTQSYSSGIKANISDTAYNSELQDFKITF